MTTLEDCNYGDTDKGSTVHDYLGHYERHLEPHKIGILTEIGVWQGGSLRMWSRWIPHAEIFGIDNEPQNYTEVSDTPYPRVHFVPGDATSEIGPWHTDVLIDDGSHHGDEQMAAFDRWWPCVRPGGWYVIEDLATVWSDYFREGAQMERFLWHRLESVLRNNDATELHAYDQIVFLKKR